MNELDPIHEATRNEARERITALVNGKSKPLVAEVVHIPGETDSEEIS